MLKWLFRLVAFVVLPTVVIVGLVYAMADPESKRLMRHMPTNRSVLFWSQDTRDATFRAMDRLSIMAKTREVAIGPKAYELPAGPPLKLDDEVDRFMRDQRSAALIIIHDGKVRLEKYGMDFTAQGRWTSFSVAKSITSTLVGAAIKDGYIKSLDDKVADYVAELKGSAYADVSIRQLLTMTSGIGWNEDYTDRNSDVARFNEHKAGPGEDQTASYMKTLKRVHPAGTKWNYSTGETNLVGILVSSATKKPLAQYLSEKIWAPFGMEQKATWILGKTGHEISGCCLNAATRDFARFGLFMLNGGKVNGQAILPEGWIEMATTKQADINSAGNGYGFQWWTQDDGDYLARGIFGQGIFIDPKRKLVIAVNGNWPKASDPNGLDAQRLRFYETVQKAIDEGR